MRQIPSAIKDRASRGGMMRGLVCAVLLSLVAWIGAVQVALMLR